MSYQQLINTARIDNDRYLSEIDKKLNLICNQHLSGFSKVQLSEDPNMSSLVENFINKLIKIFK